MVFIDGVRYLPRAGGAAAAGARPTALPPFSEEEETITMRAAFFRNRPSSRPLAAQVTVIQNGTVHTVTRGTFKGSIVIRDGKIAEVGEEGDDTGGARAWVDATGKHVIPGIIDAHTPHRARFQLTNRASASAPW
jgi:hypothetical protein